MIAMALACEPQLLIADEPTTALDVTVQLKILDLLKDLQARLGMSLLLITHDLNLVRRIAHRVCVMQQGRIVEQASCQELFAAPRHPIPASCSTPSPAVRRQATRPVKPCWRWTTCGSGSRSAKACSAAPWTTSRRSTGSISNYPAGRRWASLAKAARASRPLAWRSCGCWKARAASASKAPGWTVSRNMTCARYAARCRWCSRTRMAASAHACVSARSSAKACASIGIGSEAEQEQAIIDALVEVGLDPQTRYRYPHEFSGGQRQLHRHRPGTGAETGTDPARRTDLGARPHRAAPGRGIAAATAGQVQPHLPVHQPRPGGGQGAQPPADGGLDMAR